MLVKTDENGDIIWNKTYGGRRTDNGHGILQTNDGGYIISAITESYGAGSSDAWLIKTDKYGNEQWNKTYGTKDKEHFWEVHNTMDEGYIMIGYAEGERRDAWIVKTNDEGNVQWDKKFGPAYQGLSIKQCIDGGYIFLAEVKDTVFGGYLNAWMVKIDEDGNEEWDKLFITPIGEDRFAVHHNIQLTSDGGYILTGVTNAVTPVYSVGDMWLCKIDGNGNILWEKIIGGSEYDSTYTVSPTSDGGFIISGMTKSFGSGDNFNAWLVKVSDYENKCPSKPDKPEGPTSGKPGRDYTYSSTAIEPDGEHLYYIWDWGDGNYSDWLDKNEATYRWSYEDHFEIRVKVKDIYGGESEWSDPLVISIPKNKLYLFNWFYRFLEQQPRLFPLLRQILKI